MVAGYTSAVAGVGYAFYRAYCPSAVSPMQSASMSSLSSASNFNREDNPHVFFDVEIDGQNAGRITMEVSEFYSFIGIVLCIISNNFNCIIASCDRCHSVTTRCLPQNS